MTGTPDGTGAPRRLTPTDEAAADRLLQRYASTSMFLLAGMRQGGLARGVWAGLSGLSGLEGLVWHNPRMALQLQAPRGLEGCIDVVLAASGRPVTAVVGPWQQVEAALAHLGATEHPVRLSSEERLYELSLDELRVPQGLASGAVVVRQGRPEERPRLAEWRAAYAQEIEDGPPPPDLMDRATAEVDAALAEGRGFVTDVGGRAVAWSTFNAATERLVQIGGVYTPPEHRGAGHAQAVVAGSLLVARAAGVERAILFTSQGNVAAQRAYEALGFRVTGTFGLHLFASPLWPDRGRA